jgi:hypothetical protein
MQITDRYSGLRFPVLQMVEESEERLKQEEAYDHCAADGVCVGV